MYMYTNKPCTVRIAKDSTYVKFYIELPINIIYNHLFTIYTLLKTAAPPATVPVSGRTRTHPLSRRYSRRHDSRTGVPYPGPRCEGGDDGSVQ